jgi:hypothetical protein
MTGIMSVSLKIRSVAWNFIIRSSGVSHLDIVHGSSSSFIPVVDASTERALGRVVGYCIT